MSQDQLTHTKNLLCPICGTYLLSAPTGKNCNNCGYFRLEARLHSSTTSDAMGEGIDPIAHNPKLLRPEERKPK